MLKLDESLFQFITASDDQSSDIQEVDSPANADAHNSRKDIKKELKTQLKDHEKNKEAFIKINHEREPKSMKTKELKKLHLNESLFESREQISPSRWAQVDKTSDDDYRYCGNGGRSWVTRDSDHIDTWDSREAAIENGKKNYKKSFKFGTHWDVEELTEASAVLERPATKELFYKAKRGPLADIIQDELTTGEVVYSRSSSGGWNPTFTPSLNLPEEHVGVMYDDSGNVFIEAKAGDPETASKIKAVGEKYNKSVTISGPVKYADPDKQYIIRIEVDEGDFDGNYVDPNVPVRSRG